METSLRPMTLGEILDRTAQLYRSNFVLFAGIASVYAGALLVLGLAVTGVQEWMRIEHMNQGLLWMTGVSVLLTWILIFVLGGISGAANNCAVAWVHLGEPATIRGAYRAVLPRVGRYLWLMVLKTFFAWSPVILIYAGFIGVTIFFRARGMFAQPGTAGATVNGPAVVTVGVIAVLLFLAMVPAGIYGVFMGLRYALALPASVVENLKARPAIRRSIQLTKFSRGRIFLLWLLVAVIEIGLVGVTQSFFFVLAFKHHQQLPAGWRILQQIVSFFTTTFVAPIPATGLTLFYYDQRVRKEGYDIEWMMQSAGLTVPQSAEPPPLPWELPAATQAAQSPEPPGDAALPPATPENAHE